MNTGSISDEERWAEYSSILMQQALSANVLRQFARRETRPRGKKGFARFRRHWADDTVDVPVQPHEDETGMPRETDLEEIAAWQGSKIGGMLDELAYDVLRTGTNVRYAGGKTARNAVDRTSRITPGGIRAMVAEMHRRKGRRFGQDFADGGSYIVLCHTDLEPEIRDLEIHDLDAGTHDAFVPASEYDLPGRKRAYSGELGSFGNVRFVTSSEFGPFRGAGALTDSTAHRTSGDPDDLSQKRFDVYPVLMLARDSFGFTGPCGSEGDDSSIVQPTEAPFAGGLVRARFGFACEILNQSWVCRLEVVASVPSQRPEEIHEEHFESRPTGVELEVDDSPEPGDPEPWDPEKIRIHTKHYSLRQVVDMIKEGDIDLAPDFQRHYVWKERQRSGLIESLLLGIPLPSFYFNEDSANRLQVVDGVQRLTTVYRYLTNPEVKLGDLTYLHDLTGQGYEDLAPPFRRRLGSAQFVVHVIDPQTPYRVKFDIFRRINTGGTSLSAQEIRHCMSKTRSREFLKELVGDESFVTATGGALNDHPRMADRELALRFVAFRLFTSDDYSEHDSFNDFLGFVTNRLDDLAEEDLDGLRNDFVRGMTNGYAVFGDHAFRKWPRDATRKSPINRALFESWGTVLADYEESAIRNASENLRNRARDMMNDDSEFDNSITSSTGNIRSVRTRLDKVRELVREVVR